MNVKSILSRCTSNFYLHSITLMICSVIITLIIGIKLYVWDKTIENEDKTSINYFFIENHPFIMTAVLLSVGFSLLVPRICADLKPLFTASIHGLLNGVAVTLSLAPMYTLVTGLLGNKIAQHFYSIHCWFGGIALFFIMAQFLMAIVYYSLSLVINWPQFIIDRFLISHRNIGHTIFGLICLSFVLGISEMNSIYMEPFPEEYRHALRSTNMLALSAVFFCLIVLYLVFSRVRLETQMSTIRVIRSNEKQRFISRVIEKQNKNKEKQNTN